MGRDQIAQSQSSIQERAETYPGRNRKVDLIVNHPSFGSEGWASWKSLNQSLAWLLMHSRFLKYQSSCWNTFRFSDWCCCCWIPSPLRVRSRTTQDHPPSCVFQVMTWWTAQRPLL